LNDNSVPTSPVSSFKHAKEIAETLKHWIQEGTFLLSRPAELLPTQREFKPLGIRRYESRVKDVMTTRIITAKPTDEIKLVASLIVKHGIDHVPIVDESNRLVGIITSWDVARAVAEGSESLSEVMSSRVVAARQSETVDIVANRLSKNNISGMPVVDDENRLIGMVTTDGLAKTLRRGRRIEA